MPKKDSFTLREKRLMREIEDGVRSARGSGDRDVSDSFENDLIMLLRAQEQLTLLVAGLLTRLL